MSNIDLQKKIISSINNADVVSFDIFDTLLHRRVMHPIDVFEMVKKYIMSKKQELYYENEALISDFPNIRKEAETKTREVSYKRFGHHEILFDDIYETIFTDNSITIEHLDIIKKIEIECELFCFYPNIEVKKLYEYALEQNKKVVISTDMYLPTNILTKILETCGYKNYTALFCSGELKLSKGKGDLYPYICKQLKTKPSKVLHMGDNYHSDYEMAKKAGLNAAYIDYKYESDSKNIYKNCNYGADHNFRHFTDSIIEASIVKLTIEDTNDSELYKVGYSVFGPLFLGYFLWFINNIKEKKVDKLLFFARDAYLIRELYLKYADKFDVTIPEEYVYISRASSLLSSFTDYNIDRLWHLFSGRAKKSLKEKLTTIGFDVHEIRNEITRMGFEDIDTEIGFSSDKVHSLLIRLPQQLQHLAKEKRMLVKEYVKEIIGDHKKLAVIDIGWTGNMQGGFSRIAKLINPTVTFDGYYLGTSNGLLRHNQLQDNEYNGYIAHNGKPISVYENVLVPGGIELLEFAFVAPHGTTLGYKLKDDKVVPVFEKNATDEDYFQKSSQLQKGAMSFIDEILPMILKIGIENFIKVNWAQPFYNFAYAPSEQDALVFGSLTHSDSATDTKTRLPLAPKIGKKLDKSSKEYMEAYEKAIWKKGFEVINAKN